MKIMLNLLNRYCISLLLVLSFFACNEKEKTGLQKKVISANQHILDNFYKNILNYEPLKIEKTNPAAIQNLDNGKSLHYKSIANILCAVFYAKDDSYALSKKHFDLAINSARKTNNYLLQARCYNGLGICYKNLGNYELAFDNFYKALKIYETHNNDVGTAATHHNIGELEQQKGNLEQAKIACKKAIAMLNKQEEHHVYLAASHTLANVYGMSGDFKSALAIDEKCIKISEKIKSNRIKAMFVDNKANCFMYDNKLDSAEYYFDKCLELDLKINNKKQIADTYSNQGYLAMLQSNFAKAEALTLKSIGMLNDLKHKPNIINSYDILVNIYTKQGKFEAALKAKNNFHNEYKNLINEKKETATAEYKLIYETEKKEKLLAQSRVLLLENEAKSRNKNYIIIFISLFSILIGVVGFLYYKQQKLRNQQQSHEFNLISAIEKIKAQNILQEQRLSISRDLHDNIGAQLTFIISSVDNIKYGFKITNQKLDEKLTTISSFAKDTILELRDTIWAMNATNLKLEDLEMRINNFIDKAQTSQDNISFSFAIDESLRTRVYTSVEGMNLYRTIQEAVNNALKYARATIISINIKQNNEKIVVSINDNGVGFDFDTIEKGNGLNNMQKRMDEIGGTFSLKSSSSGTRIVLTA